MTTIAAQNQEAQAFLELLKRFIQIEGWKEAKPTIKQSGSLLEVVLDLYHPNDTGTKADRFVELGFPRPKVTGNKLYFSEFKKRLVPRGKNDRAYNIAAFNGEVIKNALSEITSYVKLKNIPNEISQGENFIRIQNTDCAKKIWQYLKQTLTKYAIHRKGEDIYILPKSAENDFPDETINDQNLAHAENFAAVLERVLTELFKIQVKEKEIDQKNVSLICNDQNQAANVKFIFTQCGMISTIEEGSTIVTFEVPDSFLTFEDFEELLKDVRVDSAEAGSGFIMPKSQKSDPEITTDEFNEQVRNFAYDLGYEPKSQTSMRQKSPYVYDISFKGDKLDELVLEVEKKKPDWEAKRVTPESSCIRFSHKIYSKLSSPENAEANTDAVLKLQETSAAKKIGKKLLQEIIAMQRPYPDEVKAPKDEVKTAMKLLKRIGQKLGISYKGVSPGLNNKYPNGRYLLWEGSSKKVTGAIAYFLELGYDVRFVDSSQSLFFQSLFPGKIDLNVLNTAKETPPGTSSASNPVLPVVSQPVAEGKGVALIVTVPEEQINQLLKGVSDEKLLEEFKQRTPAFKKKLFEELMKSVSYKGE